MVATFEKLLKKKGFEIDVFGNFRKNANSQVKKISNGIYSFDKNDNADELKIINAFLNDETTKDLVLLVNKKEKIESIHSNSSSLFRIFCELNKLPYFSIKQQIQCNNIYYNILKIESGKLYLKLFNGEVFEITEDNVAEFTKEISLMLRTVQLAKLNVYKAIMKKENENSVQVNERGLVLTGVNYYLTIHQASKKTWNASFFKNIKESEFLQGGEIKDLYEFIYNSALNKYENDYLVNLVTQN